jgi:hypothetical protein
MTTSKRLADRKIEKFDKNLRKKTKKKRER